MNCGAKCFRWIVEQGGAELTLGRSRDLCQTTTMGTREPDLRAALAAGGFEPELRQHITWDELIAHSATHYLVVLYQCHYSVVVSADQDSLNLFDPDWEAVVQRTRAEFEPKWNDYEIDLDWTRRDYERAAILVKRSVDARQAHVALKTATY
jgi:ABC-type bacteriocin/lantibiotic exporter with double-glycine peptidase domain